MVALSVRADSCYTRRCSRGVMSRLPTVMNREAEAIGATLTLRPSCFSPQDRRPDFVLEAQSRAAARRLFTRRLRFAPAAEASGGMRMTTMIG